MNDKDVNEVRAGVVVTIDATLYHVASGGGATYETIPQVVVSIQEPEDAQKILALVEPIARAQALAAVEEVEEATAAGNYAVLGSRAQRAALRKDVAGKLTRLHGLLRRPNPPVIRRG